MPKEIEKPEMTLGEFFGPEGLLARTHPQYEFRAGQLAMAEAVEQAFQQKKHLVVEAGTGTGKTLAYLIPALRSGRKVVISTGTKTLQEQLFFKDIPFLKEHLNAEIRACYMKGRTNFLCRQKLYDLEHQPVLKGLEELDHYARIREWEKTTETGDRAELRDLPDPIPLWARIDARRDTCTGQKCAQFDRCFITAMHRRGAGGGGAGRGAHHPPFFLPRRGGARRRFRQHPARLHRGHLRRSPRARRRRQPVLRRPGLELPPGRAGARRGEHPGAQGPG